MLRSKDFTLLITFFFVGCGATGTSAPTTVAKDPAEFTKPQQKDILDAINRARAKRRDCHDGKGLVGPAVSLSWNEELYLSAYEHSFDMAQSDTFGHEGSGTQYDSTGSNLGISSLFFDRIEANGYVEYRSIGENIAGGQKSVNDVMEALLNSPAHCTNIMSDSFREVGVAVVSNIDSEYGIYWTQNFGAKK